MSEFLEVLESPLQKSGENWEHANRVMVTFPNITERSSYDGGDKFWVTPEVVPMHGNELRWREDLTDEDKRIYGKTYALAARPSGHRYKAGDTLYLIVDGNFVNPVFKFDRRSDSLQYLDSNITDIPDANKYLPTILKSLEDAAKQRALDKKLSERKHSLRRRALGVFLGVVAAGSFTAYKIVDHIQGVERADRARAAAIREAFDEQGIDMTGAALRAHGMGFVESDPLFSTIGIPTAAPNDDFEHPRTVGMSDSACKHITTIDPDNESIIIRTDAAPERLYAVVDSTGDVQVCYFGEAPATKDSATATLAVQIKG